LVIGGVLVSTPFPGLVISGGVDGGDEGDAAGGGMAGIAGADGVEALVLPALGGAGEDGAVSVLDGLLAACFSHPVTANKASTVMRVKVFMGFVGSWFYFQLLDPAGRLKIIVMPTTTAPLPPINNQMVSLPGILASVRPMARATVELTASEALKA
jgi:hypothetical protein